MEFCKNARFDNQTFHRSFSELADSTTPSHMEWPATAARRGPGCVLPRPARTMLWRLWQWVTSLLDNLLANQLTQGRQLHGSIPIQPMPQSSIYRAGLFLRPKCLFSRSFKRPQKKTFAGLQKKTFGHQKKTFGPGDLKKRHLGIKKRHSGIKKRHLGSGAATSKKDIWGQMSFFEVASQSRPEQSDQRPAGRANVFF